MINKIDEGMIPAEFLPLEGLDERRSTRSAKQTCSQKVVDAARYRIGRTLGKETVRISVKKRAVFPVIPESGGIVENPLQVQGDKKGVLDDEERKQGQTAPLQTTQVIDPLQLQENALRTQEEMFRTQQGILDSLRREQEASSISVLVWKVSAANSAEWARIQERSVLGALRKKQAPLLDDEVFLW